MQRSTGRIRVSHAGALPRPSELQRLFDGGPDATEKFQQALPAAVAEVVDQQVTAGVDVVNDGEISKRGLFIGYVRDRMAGFNRVGQAHRPGRRGRDRLPPAVAAIRPGGGDQPAALVESSPSSPISCWALTWASLL